MDFIKFCIYLILLLLYLFCPSPWGSIEFKRKIEISSHDKERRDWNLHLKHENHVKMEKDFLYYQLSSQRAHRSFFLISYYIHSTIFSIWHSGWRLSTLNAHSGINYNQTTPLLWWYWLYWPFSYGSRLTRPCIITKI